MATLSFRERNSKVWRVNNAVYKSQPKYLMDNEIWCLERMAKYGCVPQFERLELELMRMEYLEKEPITDVNLFVHNAVKFIENLRAEGIRHGDLTPPHIFPRNNNVVVIDWAESRVWSDPRPDKREDGDSVIMGKSIREII